MNSNLKIKLMIFIFNILFIFVSSSMSSATTYHVDSRNGNDKNPGTLRNAPWRTLFKVNFYNFQPGDSILLKRGEEWRDELVISSSGSPELPITYGAYGNENLPKPIINGSEIITDWSRYDVDIWQAYTNAKPLGVWFGKVMGNKVGDIDELLQENDWFWDSMVLYIYSSMDPNRKFKNPGIEAADRKSCVRDANREHSYIVIEDLHLTHNGVQNDYYGAIDCRNSSGRNWTIKNCDIIDVATIGILLIYDNCKVLNNNILNCKRSGVLLHQNNIQSRVIGNYISYCESGVSFFGNEIVITQNKIHHNTWNGIMGRHLYDKPNITNNIITRNEIFANGQGLQEWLRRDPSQRDVTNFDGLWFGNMDSSIIAYNLVYNNQYGHGIHLDDGCEYNLVANNVVYGHLDNGTIRYACGLVIEHGTDAYTGKCELSLYNKFINNIVYNNYCQIGLAGIKPECRNVDYSSNIFDYNNLNIGPQGKNIGWDCYQDHTLLESWQASTGQDSHSISVDPLFFLAVPKEATDFMIMDNSPCKNAGFGVELKEDFFGNPLIDIPDIGFHEIQTKINTQPPPIKNLRARIIPSLAK